MHIFWAVTIPALLLLAFLTFFGLGEKVNTAFEKRNIPCTAGWLVLIGYCAVWILLLAFKFYPEAVAQENYNTMLMDTYVSAAELACQGQYEEASALLGSVDVHQGTGSITWSEYRLLDDFCSAMQAFEAKDWEGTVRRMPSYDLDYLPERIALHINGRRAYALQSSKKVIQDEQNKQYKKALAKAQQSIAYVGMSERFINQTKLGPYHDKLTRHPWKSSPITYYHFYWYSEYVTVTCEGGVVTKVVMNSQSSSGSRKHSSDPYNAKGYDDPEDFYEDYYDEFDGFEDAEDYYDQYH